MQSAWKKLKKWFERQIPHPRETMIFVIIIMFLIGKLIMLYIDQTSSVPYSEEDLLYYDPNDPYYLEVEDFVEEGWEQR